jgi:tRNA wybutosine-synthesizing protein 2
MFYEKLRESLDIPNKEDLPRGYFLVGKILVLRLKPSLYKYRKKIGEACLKILPYVHTVILEKGIEGEYRKPKIEIIAGCKCHPTQTILKEHDCQFLIDISKVMWSKGNKSERQRIVKLAKPKEIIVDMFAGIGYFSIFLAKKVKKVYSIDINPVSIEFLRKNVWLNNVENKVEILQGDCRKYSKFLENTADRIIMGYLHDTEKFFPHALRIAKKNAIIHFHRALKIEEIEKTEKKLIEIARKEKVKIKFLRVVRVKSYAPKVWHMVLDIKKEQL